VHAVDVDAVMRAVQSAPEGLSSTEAMRRLGLVGENRPVPELHQGFFGELAESLTEPLQLLLVAVGVLSFVWGEVADGVAILVVIAAVVVVETLTEARAGRAIRALHSLAAPRARVVRDGAVVEIDAATVVPGDMIMLVDGDIVAADARVGAASGLRLDESSMTGEPEPAAKGPAAVATDAPLAERTSMVYAGTVVVAGEGAGIVVATGAGTELGVLGASAASEREPPSPLQQAMAELAKSITAVAIAVSLVVPLIGVARGRPVKEMVLAGLTLAFATIPEELPILVAVLLAVGSRRLARKGALVRRLGAAETLGSVTLVVTDKTGTLTENRFQLAAIAGDRRSVLATGLAASSANTDREPLEAALAAAACAEGVAQSGEAVATFAFDPERRRMSSVRTTASADFVVAVKGAPESVLAVCSLAEADRVAAEDQVARLAGRGLRVLGIAERRVPSPPADADTAERGLHFVGLAAFDDPLRSGVVEAVASLGAAGIRTVVVTGDHPLTAGAVANAIGLRGDVLVGGAYLETLDDAALAERLACSRAVARATPADKLRLVRVAQASGEVVVVTGDGVNDAPALARADVGVAMGQRGTELARQTAGVVLTDDAYPTIVAAIEGGRAIRSQLRRAVAFYLGAKVALVTVVAVALAVGLPSPFAPVHIVVLEVFMDLGASLAFVSEPSTTASVESRSSQFLDRTFLAAVVVVAVALGASVLGAYLIVSVGSATGTARAAALAAWLAGHALVAWCLRQHLDTPLRVNPAFPAWALTATLVGVALVATPLGSSLGLLHLDQASAAVVVIAIAVALAVAAGARRVLRLGPDL